MAGRRALLDEQGALAAASGSAPFFGTKEPLRVLVNIFSPREANAYRWDAAFVVTGEVDRLTRAKGRSLPDRFQAFEHVAVPRRCTFAPWVPCSYSKCGFNGLLSLGGI